MAEGQTKTAVIENAKAMLEKQLADGAMPGFWPMTRRLMIG
jgi:hypothetical protein